MGRFLATSTTAGQVEKFNEVRQWPHWRGRTFRIPAHLDSTRHRLYARTRQKHFMAFDPFLLRLTHPVTLFFPTKTIACLTFGPFALRQLSFLGLSVYKFRFAFFIREAYQVGCCVTSVTIFKSIFTPRARP